MNRYLKTIGSIVAIVLGLMFLRITFVGIDLDYKRGFADGMDAGAEQAFQNDINSAYQKGYEDCVQKSPNAK